MNRNAAVIQQWMSAQQTAAAGGADAAAAVATGERCAAVLQASVGLLARLHDADGGLVTVPLSEAQEVLPASVYDLRVKSVVRPAPAPAD